MVSISCFYNHFYGTPINITFIQFEKYFKVILNDRIIILSNKKFLSNKILFQYYIISILCTLDTSKIDINFRQFINKNIYGVYTQQYWKNLYFTNYYDFIELSKSNKKKPKNPLNMMEPKRQSSSKKIKKFEKLFDSNMKFVKNPIELFIELYENKTDDIIKYVKDYEKYITILQMHDSDIYSIIEQYL